jgi:hemoglobin-like flavoprotein
MDISSSIRALFAHDELIIKRFYTRFFERDERVREMFRDVDMNRQAIMLTTALNVVELNYTGDLSATKKFLKMLGREHALMHAPKELYPIFCDCLLETLAEFHGSDWDVALEKQWRGAIERAFAVMFEAYDECEGENGSV